MFYVSELSFMKTSTVSNHNHLNDLTELFWGSVVILVCSVSGAEDNMSAVELMKAALLHYVSQASVFARELTSSCVTEMNMEMIQILESAQECWCDV